VKVLGVLSQPTAVPQGYITQHGDYHVPCRVHSFSGRNCPFGSFTIRVTLSKIPTGSGMATGTRQVKL
jgi:hypothetical protein